MVLGSMPSGLLSTVQYNTVEYSCQIDGEVCDSERDLGPCDSEQDLGPEQDRKAKMLHNGGCGGVHYGIVQCSVVSCSAV